MKTKITKEQYEEAHARHIELWDWLFHHPSKEKGDCPKWEENGGVWKREHADCFACGLAPYNDAGREHDCRKCPIDWEFTEIEDVGYAICQHPRSPFEKWVDAGDAKSPKTRKKYAALVRDAVWMPYEEWIRRGS